MPTLHIEHPITDFATWRAAFDGFAEQRRAAGVTDHRVWRPVDDQRYVVVDLDFATTDQATAFSASCGRGSGPLRRTRPRSPANPGP